MIDSKRGGARELIGQQEYQELLAKGSIASDDRRRRPLWFDGRFLDAAALKSEQNYILGRQSDIARVAGVGVVDGLEVKFNESLARAVRISAGHGITPSGELVMVDDDIEVDLANVAEIQKLDASFGLAEIPKQGAFNRSGLYILALRPVEFTGNPIASYPTSINGERSVEDGHIIEATAITLIPYPDQGARLELDKSSRLDQRRRMVVHDIFVNGSRLAQPENVLPLAMVALNLGVIEWLDVFMVRREVGALDHDVFGLGLSPRALREAYLRQYYQHLTEVMTESGNSGGHFPAADHFAALPAAGPMPAAAIDSGDFSQLYFPSEMDVDLSIIAEDELPALIDDSYTLPPLDLTLPADAQESTSILVMIPVPRSRLRQLSLSLASLTRKLPAAAPGLVARRKPLDALQLLSQRSISTLLPSATAEPEQTTWKQLLQDVELLWYVRRRNLNVREEVAATAVTVMRAEAAIEASVTNRFKELGLTTTVNAISKKSTASAQAEIINLFSSPLMLKGSNITTKALVNEINNLETVDRDALLKLSERYTSESFGSGISRLETANPELTTTKKKADLLAATGMMPELDAVTSALSPAELEKFSSELAEASTGADASSEKLAKLIEEKQASLASTTTTLASRRALEANLKIRELTQ